jgi:DNA-binding LacI/PurR family transcriptional regulator
LRVGRGDGCALRVASHDDHPFSRFTCPALTTAAHEYEAVADKCMETLFSLIEAGGRFDPEETLIPARLILQGLRLTLFAKFTRVKNFVDAR